MEKNISGNPSETNGWKPKSDKDAVLLMAEILHLG